MFVGTIIFLVTSLLTSEVFTQDVGNLQMNLTSRVDQASTVAYAKAIKIENRITTGSGERYSVTFELICSLKAKGGTLLPEIFVINNMGEQLDGQPTREVNIEEDYVLLLQKQGSVYVLNEVNQQTAVIPGSWGNMKVLSSYVRGCLTGLCRPGSNVDWKPMSEDERADIAEIIVWIKVEKRHDYGTGNGQYVVEAKNVCEMKLPADLSNLENTFNISSVGALDGACEDRHLTEGHEFIVFLTRHFAYFPVPGQTIPPYILENYMLALHEVNFQHAIFNISRGEKVLEDYVSTCNKSSDIKTHPILLIICLITSWIILVK